MAKKKTKNPAIITPSKHEICRDEVARVLKEHNCIMTIQYVVNTVMGNQVVSGTIIIKEHK